MAEERVQRRLAAILAADVVGYSRLMGTDETGTRARFNDQLASVLQPAIDEHHGRLVKMLGDGFLVEFGSVVDGVQCAVNIQNDVALQQNSEPDERKILFRIGVHLGDVIVEDDDIHGDGVNIAARLEGLAETGGICISASVYEQVRHKLTLSYEDIGDQSLKNIVDPVHVYQLVLEREPIASDATNSGEAILRRPAVAVLPFQNMSGDPEQEYFVDGLTEDIITALSSWRFFPVIARNSTFAYKGKSPDIRQVGEDLGARYVIEGSVRKAANRVRVTAQLINAETGHHVWAERFDRELQDIFDLQDEITGKIAAVVSPELIKAESERSMTKRPENLDAWDYCQRGKFQMNEISKSAGIRARVLFEHALELDPHLVDAWCGVAHTYHRELFSGFSDDSREAKIKILEAARRAVALDDANATAHYHLCHAYMHNRRPAEAVAEGKRAVDLNPISPQSHSGLGTILTLAGRPEEGAVSLERTIRLNPRYPRVRLHHALLARAYLDSRQYDEAADQARQAIQRGRAYLNEHIILASALGHLGRTEEARAVLDDLEEYRGLRIKDFGLCPLWQLYQDSGPNEHLLEGLRKAGLPE